MDVYKMVTRAGWDVYPIDVSGTPSEAPHGLSVSLVPIT